jgi:hypothetical protein
MKYCVSHISRYDFNRINIYYSHSAFVFSLKYKFFLMLSLHGKIDKVRETGDAAWRLILSTEQIYASKDSGLIEALESLVALRWMAPDGHIMCYPIRNHTLLSTLLCTTNMQSM